MINSTNEHLLKITLASFLKIKTRIDTNNLVFDLTPGNSFNPRFGTCSNSEIHRLSEINVEEFGKRLTLINKRQKVTVTSYLCLSFACTWQDMEIIKKATTQHTMYPVGGQEQYGQEQFMNTFWDNPRRHQFVAIHIDELQYVLQHNKLRDRFNILENLENN